MKLEIKYSLDDNEERYVPKTHTDAVKVKGYSNLTEWINESVATTGWQEAKLLNDAKTKNGFTPPQYKYDNILGIEQFTLKFCLENVSDDEEILEIPSKYVGDTSKLFNVVSTLSQSPNKVEIKTDGKIKFNVHDDNNWNSHLYIYLEVTWRI